MKKKLKKLYIPNRKQQLDHLDMEFRYRRNNFLQKKINRGPQQRKPTKPKNTNTLKKKKKKTEQGLIMLIKQNPVAKNGRGASESDYQQQ